MSRSEGLSTGVSAMRAKSTGGEGVTDIGYYH